MAVSIVNAMRVGDVVRGCVCLVTCHEREITCGRIYLVVSSVKVERVGAVNISVDFV